MTGRQVRRRPARERQRPHPRGPGCAWPALPGAVQGRGRSRAPLPRFQRAEVLRLDGGEEAARIDGEIVT